MYVLKHLSVKLSAGQCPKAHEERRDFFDGALRGKSGPVVKERLAGAWSLVQVLHGPCRTAIEERGQIFCCELMVFVRTLPSHVLPPMKYSLPGSLPCEEAGLSTKDLTPLFLRAESGLDPNS